MHGTQQRECSDTIIKILCSAEVWPSAKFSYYLHQPFYKKENAGIYPGLTQDHAGQASLVHPFLEPACKLQQGFIKCSYGANHPKLDGCIFCSYSGSHSTYCMRRVGLGDVVPMGRHCMDISTASTSPSWLRHRSRPGTQPRVRLWE